MFIPRFSFSPTLVASLVISGFMIAPVSAETLGEMLRESGWERIIGTWVDAETQGEELTVTYAWRFPDRLIESTSKTREKEELSLMGVNAKTGEVFHVSADSEGGSSLGKWSTEGEEAILDLLFVTGTGEEGALRFRLRFEQEDTLVVTIDLPEPVVFRLVRKTEQ